MEIQHSEPADLRAVARALTVSIVCLWIAIPALAAFWIFISLISIVFNDSGNARQQALPFLNGVLLFDAGLICLLIWSLRTRRALAQRLYRARMGMIILSVAYIVIAIVIASCSASFPSQLVLLPGVVALLPGALGAWWFIYFLRPATRLAFQNAATAAASMGEPVPPVE